MKHGHNLKNRYDVVIVGAGPAGLACGMGLRDTRLSVLILERKDVIGPKTCAGGLTHLAQSFPVSLQQARTFPLQRIVAGRHRFFLRLAHPLKTMTREDLAAAQLKELRNRSNIHIRTGVRAVGMDGDRLRTSHGDVSYRYLVGADGATSFIRKELGLSSRICMGQCYTSPRITDHPVWHLDPDNLPLGYVWEFPHRDHTNVGVYYDPQCISSGRARSYLERYIEQQGMEIDKGSFQAGVVNHGYTGHMFGNRFLVGDAAGLASRATGEGISFAMTSGLETARKILDPAYPMPELRRLVRHKRIQESFLQVMDVCPWVKRPLFALFMRMIRYPWVQETVFG
ncbi:FAD-dependent oxidoreductase [Desulfoplanes formicivorans]|uniref:Geranylgeranyl reductase n=1 Tax=Desulfoplanes formicivorans TaxID=1592317 RepID=A0A194AE94_9BACT|nr:NAD(P)/FAD-dependent oxidoreductase [Desulfoplanes formicivorans]GAU07648.1 geranylgeranyl reductase [Desulfoplanes formicivorans]